MRILLVEDDVVVATGVEEALRREGYSIDHCLSAEDALPVIATTGYDLAIVDIGLPGMNGRSFIDRIRRDGNSIPVIILSALDGFDDRVRGLDVGADDYVTKPFSIADSRRTFVRGFEETRARAGRGSWPVPCGCISGCERRMCPGPRSISRRANGMCSSSWRSPPPRIVSKQKLTDSLGGWRSEITSNAVEIYVSRIRAKLHGTGVGVLTVRGLGYRLEEQH